jgi:hypothetical protein
VCSLCHDELKVAEIAGRYFAAFYCKRCWNDGWTDPKTNRKYESMRAVESRENYN